MQLLLCTVGYVHIASTAHLHKYASRGFFCSAAVLGNVVLEGIDYQCRHVGVALERHQFHLVVESGWNETVQALFVVGGDLVHEGVPRFLVPSIGIASNGHG